MAARAWFSLAALAALASTSQAQGPQASALIGAEYRSVSFGDGYRGTKVLSEFAVPIGMTVPLGRRFTADVGTYFVSASMTDDADSTFTISGLTDVIVRGAFQLKQDVAVLTVSLNLPTGTATLDDDQTRVAGATATDLIPYPVQNFGSGFNVTTGVALAAPVGSWALGIAGSYRLNGAYEPFSSIDTSLTPGGEVRMRLGADRIVGQGRVSLGVTYSTFSSDDFGARSNKPGARIIPQASWAFPVGNNSLSLYLWDIYRSAGQDTTLGGKENTLALGAIFSLRTGRNVLRPQLEYRMAQKDFGSGMEANGNLLGLSLRYALAASSRLTVVPGMRLDVGSLPDGATSTSFTGYNASLTIRTTF